MIKREMKDKGLGMAWQIEGVHYNMKIKRIEFFKTMNKTHALLVFSPKLLSLQLSWVNETLSCCILTLNDDNSDDQCFECLLCLLTSLETLCGFSWIPTVRPHVLASKTVFLTQVSLTVNVRSSLCRVDESFFQNLFSNHYSMSATP